MAAPHSDFFEPRWIPILPFSFFGVEVEERVVDAIVEAGRTLEPWIPERILRLHARIADSVWPHRSIPVGCSLLPLN